jgi:hypothetical protein
MRLDAMLAEQHSIVRRVNEYDRRPPLIGKGGGEGAVAPRDKRLES